jgi:RNA-directed DNA polymerase
MTGYSFSIAYAAVLPAVNRAEGEGLNWDSVDWRAQEAIVRRLRQRIFKATREGDWPRPPALHPASPSRLA